MHFMRGEAESLKKTDDALDQALKDRTIIITRARAQAAEFTRELERYGARVILCPTIEINPPESFARLDEAIENLYGYDWLIFTSVNGVEYFLRRFLEKGHDLAEIDELQVCAIGEATADHLRDAQIHVDVVPAQFKAEGIFEALKDYLGGEENFNGLNFLIPRAAVARDYLPAALEKAGARADVVPAYRTLPPDDAEHGRTEALLMGGAVDCITFTSSSTVINFAQLFDTTDLTSLLGETEIACIGDITSETARRYGLETDIQPEEFTIPALARAIAEYFAQKD